MARSDIAEQLQRIRKIEFDYCRDHLLYWVRNYCVIEDKDAAEIVVQFQPWQEQESLLTSIAEHRLNIILKARQLGITWCALYYCAHDLIFNPGHTVVALSKTQEDAFELVRRVSVVLTGMPELLQGGSITWKASAEQIIITDNKTGLKSTFKSFPASPSAGRSFTGNILLLDEWAFQEYAEQIWQSAYPTINRPTGGKVIGLSTIKKGTLFERLWVEENAFNKIFLSVFADPRRTREWYKATERDLGIKIKEEYPRTAEEALSNLGGSFFSEFDYDIHTCEPFAIPTDWAIYDTMDYGLDMFAHYKIAIDGERNCYVFHEIYESNLIISAASNAVKAAETEHIVAEDGTESIKAWYPPRERLAPPDLWNRMQESGKSRALLFEENGLSLTMSNNDRAAGWLAVKELLKPFTNAEGVLTAQLKIFRTCKNLIRVLPQILIDEKNVNDCAKEPHELTHAPDALRYFAIYWTSPQRVKKERPKVKYRADQWEDLRNARTPEERELILDKYGEPL